MSKSIVKGINTHRPTASPLNNNTDNSSDNNT